MVLNTRTKCMRRISLIVCVHALIFSHDPSHQNSGSGPTLCWLGPAKTASLLLVLVAAANERAAEPLSIQLRVRPITSSVLGPAGDTGAPRKWNGYRGITPTKLMFAVETRA